MESLRILVNGRELYLLKAVDRGYFDYDKMNEFINANNNIKNKEVEV